MSFSKSFPKSADPNIDGLISSGTKMIYLFLFRRLLRATINVMCFFTYYIR